jgi:hypothetical protein
VFLSPRSWSAHVQFESLIAQSLRLRGARVTFVTCGGGREICDRVNISEGPPLPCRTCTGYVEPALAAHGFSKRTLASFSTTSKGDVWPVIDTLTTTELRDVEYQGFPLGQTLESSISWFLLSTRASQDPLSGPISRSFLREGRRVVEQCERMLKELRPDTLVLLNGMLFFESIAMAVAQGLGIDVVTYERGHRAGTLFFRRGEIPAPRYDISELWSSLRTVPLTPVQDDELDGYLNARSAGRSADMPFRFEAADMTSHSPGRLAVLFTNVTWDTAALDRDIGFDGIRDWLGSAIRLMEARAEDRLVVRIHPAEHHISGHRSREMLGRFISQQFPNLPPNVAIVPADDPADSYSLMKQADVGLVYTSTAGLELALDGKPVVVAGDAHYAKKGFTLDVTSVEEFVETTCKVLDDPCSYKPDVPAARRYAYAFFFTAMIPFPLANEPLPGLVHLEARHRVDLLPGADPGIDRICDGILGDTDFFPICSSRR